LKDNKSTNGTYVNNKRIACSRIENKDKITFGNINFQVFIEKKEEDSKIYEIK